MFLKNFRSKKFFGPKTNWSEKIWIQKKFNDQRVYCLDIAAMDKCPQGTFCLDKCQPDIMASVEEGSRNLPLKASQNWFSNN